MAKIWKRIETITKQQKDSLRTKVVAIDKQLENVEITDEDAPVQRGLEELRYFTARLDVLGVYPADILRG